MNKYQEALKDLKKYYANPLLISPLTRLIAFKTIEELVEKATPKKPYEDKVTNYYKTYYYCSNCNEAIQHDEIYCKHCGQALDWSEEDETRWKNANWRKN